MPSSVLSAYSSHSQTTSTEASEVDLRRVEPTEDTPFVTFVDDNGWAEVPEDIPEFCTTLWIVHHEHPHAGVRWYFFRHPNCPEDHPSYNLYEEWDDWYYVPNYSWDEDNMASYTPANLLAREDPLFFLAYLYLDPNRWVEDVMCAMRMDIACSPIWGSQDHTPTRSRWNKANRHVRKRMSPEERQQEKELWDNIYWHNMNCRIRHRGGWISASSTGAQTLGELADQTFATIGWGQPEW